LKRLYEALENEKRLSIIGVTEKTIFAYEKCVVSVKEGKEERRQQI
jgi:hypothetical protein